MCDLPGRSVADIGKGENTRKPISRRYKRASSTNHRCVNEKNGPAKYTVGAGIAAPGTARMPYSSLALRKSSGTGSDRVVT